MEDDLRQSALFESPSLPYGLIYRPGFLARDEEAALLTALGSMPFREARFREYFAKRRIVHFHAPEHAASEQSARDDIPSGELPPLLCALRRRVAAWLGFAPESFVHALASEYRPGTPIGWHRDKPVYGVVVGISVGGRGTMRFRPLPNSSRAIAGEVVALELEARSIYVMQGAIRWQWQHSMLPMKELRYSITFRTQANGHREDQLQPQAHR